MEVSLTLLPDRRARGKLPGQAQPQRQAARRGPGRAGSDLHLRPGHAGGALRPDTPDRWLLGSLGLRAQLRPLWVFVIAGVAILLANIFFNKENAAAPALVFVGPVKVTGPALWAAGTLWLRLLCFRAAVAGLRQDHGAAASHPQPGAPAPPQLPGGLRDHGRLPHASAVPDRLPDHTRGPAGARGTGGERLPARLVAHAALRHPAAGRGGTQGGPGCHSHGCPGLRCFPGPHLPGAHDGREDGLGLPRRVVGAVAVVVLVLWWAGITRFTIA